MIKLVLALLFGQTYPNALYPDVAHVPHPSTVEIHLNDDVAASFGGMSASAYYEWAYDSGDTRFECRSTDCDGLGADCVPLYIVDGTDDVVLSGDLTIGGDTKLSTPTDGDLLICNNAGTQCIQLETQTDGELHVKDELGSFAYVVADRLLWSSGAQYLSGTQMNVGTINFTITTGSTAGFSRNMAIGTGDSTGATDLVSGDMTVFTGSTNTLGKTGDIPIYTGQSGEGQSGAGDITLTVGGEPGTGITGLKVQNTGDILYARHQKFEIVKTGLTDASANAFVRIAVPQGEHVGGSIICTVHVSDAGGEVQATMSEVYFVAVNKGGTEDCDVQESTVGAPPFAKSSGTLVQSFSCASNADDTVDISVTPNSSLTPTALEIHYQVHIDHDYAITAL